MYGYQLLRFGKHLTSTGFASRRIPQCVYHSQNFSTFNFSLSPKRNSPYSSVDSERYSSLIKSVVKSRVSSQTPESLDVENDHIYGPVVKSQTQVQRHESREPKVIWPLINCERADTFEGDVGPLTRISLERGPRRSLVPSVTRILQRTLSPEQLFYLERWKKRMIADLGEEGFKEYSECLFRNGQLFHNAVEDILTAEKKDTDPSDAFGSPEVEGFVDSISHILEDVSGVRAIESTVQHGSLNYLGIVDCVARYRGVLCVIEWKTSERPKPYLSNTYDNPLQVAAYAGALNSDDNYNYQVENGLIVVAYKDGSPAHVHQLGSELLLEFWQKWLLRLEDFVDQK
ncbi:mitochondrial genome maintenance exonuclease 1 [Gadus chalcogrammus]|uniref:mitochondrial genome maintenance exonuclease 1 n=1 Tax=Gadus chalcogrammus TaxID=1042646 RepID=UPI0024C4D248|nr:mitochondrial genome maintenance exonuclease 1 [Gadus chalcogrammus]